MVDLANITPAAAAAWARLGQAWGSPLNTTSGYRTPAYNASVGGARNSQHTHGNAYDVDVSGMSMAERGDLINAARAAGFGGVGVYNNSLHFDVGQNRAWGPDYTRASLPGWAAGYLGGDQISTSGGAAMPTTYPTEQQPRGLLEQFGIQRRGEGGPQGDLPFYQRDRFRDTMLRAATALNSLRMQPDQNIPAAMTDARQRRAGNRTAAWLAQQPGGAEFAAAIQAGADPAQVLMLHRQAMQPAQGEIREVDGRLLRLHPDGRVEEVYVPPTGGALSPELLGAANTLRDDFRTDLAEFAGTRVAYQDLSAAYQQALENPGVSDYALAVGFAKVLDPGSVAREGEVAAIASSGSLSDALKAQLTNALIGSGTLPQEVREQIMEIAERRYMASLERARPMVDLYRQRAEGAGVPFEQIGMDLLTPIEPFERGFRLPQGVTQEQWDIMTDAEKRAFSVNGG